VIGYALNYLSLISCGTGAGFLRVHRLSPCNYRSTNSQFSHPFTESCYNMPICCRRTRGLCHVPPRDKKTSLNLVQIVQTIAAPCLLDTTGSFLLITRPVSEIHYSPSSAEYGAGFKGERPGRSPRGLRKSEIEFTEYTETFASQKSQKVSLYF
jgi:hypothetical protein